MLHRESPPQVAAEPSDERPGDVHVKGLLPALAISRMPSVQHVDISGSNTVTGLPDDITALSGLLRLDARYGCRVDLPLGSTRAGRRHAFRAGLLIGPWRHAQC